MLHTPYFDLATKRAHLGGRLYELVLVLLRSGGVTETRCLEHLDLR